MVDVAIPDGAAVLVVTADAGAGPAMRMSEMIRMDGNCEQQQKVSTEAD